MGIRVASTYAVSEIGHRKNNEDAVYPVPGQPVGESRLFMVCDGVGGAEKGEVASALACRSFHEYLLNHSNERHDASFIARALSYTEHRFDEYIQTTPEAEGMATTLTLAYIEERQIILSHIGDSRIYWIRNGEILFRTEDHSLVNSLLQLGQITEEEARVHPRRNVILRAIQGTSSPTEADTQVLTDIREGDYLFLCSDGVLESLTDDQLASVFKEEKEVETIAGEIQNHCRECSRDNFSFYVISLSCSGKSPGWGQKLYSFLSSFMQML